MNTNNNVSNYQSEIDITTNNAYDINTAADNRYTNADTIDWATNISHSTDVYNTDNEDTLDTKNCSINDCNGIAVE